MAGKEVMLPNEIFYAIKRKNVEIFDDTCSFFEQDAALLKETREMANAAKCYLEDFTAARHAVKSSGNNTVVVEDSTYHCAGQYAAPGRTAVLDFANAVTPGGGVLGGSRAQEESLCRCSNLYYALKADQVYPDYYGYNLVHGETPGSDRLVYVRDVLVIKDDNAALPRENAQQYQPGDDVNDYITAGNALLPKSDRFHTDVIACAAPILSYGNGNTEEVMQYLLKLHISRGRNILEAAIDNGVDHLVLGAFGCGAFANPPEIVAEAYRVLLKDEGYERYFKKVIFAIIHNHHDNGNFEAFQRVLMQGSTGAKDEKAAEDPVTAEAPELLPDDVFYALKRRNVEILNETLNYFKGNPLLYLNTQQMMHASKLYVDGFTAAEHPVKSDGSDIAVIEESTFRCAAKLALEGRTAVLDFASATAPGGGVLSGCRAQEESLCRCSNLYFALKEQRFWDDYYSYNRAHKEERGSDRIIYVPRVTVIKDDDAVKALPNANDYQPGDDARDYITSGNSLFDEKQRFRTDVIVCAAPKLSERWPIPNDDLLKLHIKRGRNILETAIENGVDNLVLGAFGCGAFHNPPETVAEAYRVLLRDEGYGKFFKKVRFAIIHNHHRENGDSVAAFSKALG